MPATIMYAGAPEFHDIEEQDLTINHWLPPFAEYLRSKHELPTEEAFDDTTAFTVPASANFPAWRSLPLVDTHLPTGWSQRGWLQDAFAVPTPPIRAPVLVAGKIEARSRVTRLPLLLETPNHNHNDEEDDSDEDPVTKFIEHSFAFHHDTQSLHHAAAAIETPTPLDRFRCHHTLSAVGASIEEDDDDTVTSSNYPLDSPTLPAGTFDTPTLPQHLSYAQPPPPTAPRLHSIAALPSATLLTSMVPHTPTVDLVAGILSLSTRTVTVRRTGLPVDLVEMLVGDETRAGFGVTFWMDPDTSNARPHGFEEDHQDDDDSDVAMTLEQTLQRLRPGDIVLLRNIALTSFRRVVYGQSTGRRKGGWRPRTSVFEVSEEFEQGVVAVGGPLAAKIERVKEWAGRFLPAARGRAGEARRDDGRAVGRDDYERGGELRAGRVRVLQDELPPDDTPA